MGVKKEGKAVHVYLQVRQLSESFFTTWMGAFIRPIACVDSEKWHKKRRLIQLNSNETT